MQEMIDFINWFLENFPVILMTPPISAFTGLAILGWLTWLFNRMIHIR